MKRMLIDIFDMINDEIKIRMKLQFPSLMTLEKMETKEYEKRIIRIFT